jgi:hypothetical protein
MLYICYIYVIYKVYTKYIPGIFQSYAHRTNMPGIYLLQNKWVCSVPFFIIISLWYTLYILKICIVYRRDIIKKKGTEQTHCSEVGIYQAYWWHGHMTEIYQVYTWYILCIYRKVSDIPVIYQEYVWNIPYGISFVHTWIYLVYT